MRHFLSDDGSLPDLPGPALALAFHLGSIVGWVSRTPVKGLQDTNVNCRRSPGRQRCVGEIQAELSQHTRAIEWCCPLCGDRGLISGWEGTLWDKTLPS